MGPATPQPVPMVVITPMMEPKERRLKYSATSDQRVSLPLGTVTTDPTGHASIAVPHDTIQIGLWKGDGQPVWRWQTPVIVTGDVDLAYDLVTADTLPLCPAVDPTQPDR